MSDPAFQEHVIRAFECIATGYLIGNVLAIVILCALLFSLLATGRHGKK